MARIGRILLGYALAPLAAAVTALLVVAVEVGQAHAVLVRGLVPLYLLSLVLGAPVAAILRLLPVRSWLVYVLAGLAFGAILGPAIQIFSDIFSHPHGAARGLETLAWQGVRAALAGAAGLGVFWLIVVRSAAREPPGET